MIGLVVTYFWVRLFGEPKYDDAPLGVIFVAWPFTLWYFLIGFMKKLALEHNYQARIKNR